MENVRSRMSRWTMVICTLLLSMTASAGVIVIEGVYQGKDLYIQNPTGPKGVGYSVYEVQVNGEITADEINSSAFVVDLNVLGLGLGDAVLIKIVYHDGTSPKVLNREAVMPTSTFEVSMIKTTKDKILVWETTNESGELPYIIQQYRWNKWVNIGEVMGSGKTDRNTYSFAFEPHSGTNRLRVKQNDESGSGRISEDVTYDAVGVPQVEFSPKKVSTTIDFSRETSFEVYNEYGQLRKRGFAGSIDVADLEKGTYYINYDNRFGETFKK